MAAGRNGLCACLRERRGRRELGPFNRSQEKGASCPGVPVNTIPTSPHPVPDSTETQEIAFVLCPVRHYGLVRLAYFSTLI